MDHETIDALRNNFTVEESRREHLLRCWLHTSCDSCLDSDRCSWCPFTWSCVPNSHHIPLLAPAYEDQICPSKAEQWEIRTQPLGCNVSSVTALTAIVSIVSTLVVGLLILLTVLAAARVRRYALRRRRARHPPIVIEQHWHADNTQQNAAGERDPLLPSSRDDRS